MIIQLEAFILEGPPSWTHLGILNRFDIILALFSLQVYIMYPRSIFGHVHTICSIYGIDHIQECILSAGTSYKKECLWSLNSSFHARGSWLLYWVNINAIVWSYQLYIEMTHFNAVYAQKFTYWTPDDKIPLTSLFLSFCAIYLIDSSYIFVLQSHHPLILYSLELISWWTNGKDLILGKYYEGLKIKTCFLQAL